MECKQFLCSEKDEVCAFEELVGAIDGRVEVKPNHLSHTLQIGTLMMKK